jgi:hypothetical protein
MKKTKFILTAALMAMSLTACGNGEAEYKAALDSAMAQVSYSDQSITGVTGNFDLITDSISGKYDFTITYTAGNLVEYPAGYTFISISDDGKQAVVTAPNFLDKTLDFKAKYGTFAQCYIEATFHYNDKTSEAKRYNIKVNATSATDIASLYTDDLFKSGIKVETNGYYLGTYDDTNPYQAVWVADGNSGLTVYGLSALPSGIQPGDPVHLTGTTSPYNGLAEIKAPTMKKLTDTAAIAKLTQPVTTEFTKASDLVWKNLSTKVHAAGTLKDVKMTDANKATVTDPTQAYTCTGNVYVGTEKLYIYCYAKYMTAAAFSAAAAKFVEGSSVDVTGYLGIYSSDNTWKASAAQVLNPIFK